jgi:hypothetical protein
MATGVGWTREQAVEAIFAFIGADWLPMREHYQYHPDYEAIPAKEIFPDYREMGYAEDDTVEVCKQHWKRAVIREWRDDLFDTQGDGTARAWLWDADGLREMTPAEYRQARDERGRSDEPGRSAPSVLVSDAPFALYSLYTFSVADDLRHVFLAPGGGGKGADYLLAVGEDGHLSLIEDPDGEVFL